MSKYLLHIYWVKTINKIFVHEVKNAHLWLSLGFNIKKITREKGYSQKEKWVCFMQKLYNQPSFGVPDSSSDSLNSKMWTMLHAIQRFRVALAILNEVMNFCDRRKRRFFYLLKNRPLFLPFLLSPACISKRTWALWIICFHVYVCTQVSKYVSHSELRRKQTDVYGPWVRPSESIVGALMKHGDGMCKHIMGKLSYRQMWSLILDPF